MMSETEDKLLAEIAKDNMHGYWDKLVKVEPRINWRDFAENLYANSSSTLTITTYCQGICSFRQFLIEKKQLPKDAVNVISDIIAEIKADAKASTGVDTNGFVFKNEVTAVMKHERSDVYKLFNSYVIWCASRGYRPRTTKSFMLGPKRLLIHLDVYFHNNKFKYKVKRLKPKALNDEYPDNKTIKKFMNTGSILVRTMIQTLCDYGFEPTDIAQLKPKYIRFEESPVRDDTAEALKLLIGNKGLDDYIFVKKYTNHSPQYLRSEYNKAVANAGFGKLVKGKSSSWAKVETIDGHPFGKYHLKVFKKRWFSLAIASGVPEYIVMGMLGRKQYLDEYNRQPLAKKQEFARKILRAVNVYADEKTEEQQLEEIAKVMGVEKATPEQKARLKEALGIFMTMPEKKLKALLNDED